MSWLKRRAGVALLPLSVVPFLAVVPAILTSHDRYVRAHEMGPLPAPAAALTTAERARLEPLPARPGRVPVLAWHGIGDGRDDVDARAFKRQLELLRALGYRSISSADWARFRAGHAAALPPRPVLLTIDGGELDSYRRADGVLAELGMRATMFVVTGPSEAGDPRYLRWSELHRMAASGRWDVEPSARAGQTTVTIDRDGAQAPFYAARRYTRSGGLETRAGWERRVAGDLFAVRDSFAAQGLAPHVLAVPYGDVGRRTTNDPALPRLLSALLTRQFGNWFVQAADPPFTAPGAGAAERYALDRDTRPEDLYRWLRRHTKTSNHKR